MKKVKAFLAALVLSVAGVLSLNAGQAFAATCTWTGASSDSFNTAGNWSNCGSGVPQAGDNITFDITSLSANKTLTNNITSLSVATITFTGTNSNSYGFTITGNALTITGGVVANAPAKFDVPLTLGASQTWSGSSYIMVGDYSTARNISMGSSNLTISAESAYLYSVLSGSGNLVASGNVYPSKSSPSWTGATSISANGSVSIDEADGLGSGAITIAAGGYLSLCGMEGATISNALSLAGDGDSYGAIRAYTGCGGGGSGGGVDATLPAKAVLGGAVTLTGNTVVSSQNELKLTGALTGAYTIKLKGGSTGSLVIASSNNTSQTPNGTYVAEQETITIDEGDNQPGTAVSIGVNQTYIIKGVRGDTDVAVGGTLKGTGTVGALNVSGKVAPGLSPGCLNSGNLTLNQGATYEFEVGGTTACSGYDQIKVTGTVQASGSLIVSLYNGFKPVKGQTYTIIDNDGSDAVTSTFTDLAEGATFTANGYVYRISYVGGTGNDVTLTVMNVPASPDTGFAMLQANPIASMVAMVAAGGALLFLARRFKPARARATVRRR